MKEIDRMRILSGLVPMKTKEEQINEGWLQNIAAAIGMLAATAGASQTVQDLPYSDETKDKIEAALENPQVIKKLKEMGVDDNNIKRASKRFKNHKFSNIKTREVTDDEGLAKYLKLGYHLTGIETDTIIELIPEIAPDAEVEELVLTFSDDAFFESGSFVIGDKEIQEIQQALDSIDNNGEVLLNVIVESSTDKQGLSKNLQKTLMSIGYSGDNNGLSQARNNAVIKILESQGVDSSLVSQTVLSEQGDGVISPSARYVKVRLQYLTYKDLPKNPLEGNETVSYPKTYELIKAFAKKKRRRNTGKSCKVGVGKFKKGQVLCPNF